MQEHRHAHTDPRPHLPETPQEITRDLLGKFFNPRGRALFVFAGLLFLLGIVGFVMRVSGGFAHRAEWGYYAVVVVYLLSTAQAAPLLAVATRLTKGYWGKPLVRAAELFTVVGVVNLVLLLPLLMVVPPLEGRRTFWIAWEGAPQTMLFLGMFSLVVCGLGFLYTSAMPDIAAARDHAPGGRRGLLGWLARRWVGTPYQWRVVTQGITYFGCFYLMMLVAMHFLVSVEFAISFVPGWRDPIFPAFHAVSSIQAGLAMLLVALGMYRYLGGYRQYLALDQFWNPAKLLLALSLLWFYFWWSSFIVFWYGRTPAEQGVLETIMFGPYKVAFIVGCFLNFVIPAFLLIWNPVRTSIKGPIIAGSIILVGNFFDRIRIYAATFSVDPIGLELEHVPAPRLPELPDYLLFAGAIGFIVFTYMLALRVIPPMSLWELKELQILTKMRTLGRKQVIVIGKPE